MCGQSIFVRGKELIERDLLAHLGLLHHKSGSDEMQVAVTRSHKWLCRDVLRPRGFTVAAAFSGESDTAGAASRTAGAAVEAAEATVDAAEEQLTQPRRPLMQPRQQLTQPRRPLKPPRPVASPPMRRRGAVGGSAGHRAS